MDKDEQKTGGRGWLDGTPAGCTPTEQTVRKSLRIIPSLWELARQIDENGNASNGIRRALKIAQFDREVIADMQHAIWSKWMRYLFSVSSEGGDGFVTIPRRYVERWQRQMETPYAELPESEKESDRHQADLVVEAILSLAGVK